MAAFIPVFLNSVNSLENLPKAKGQIIFVQDVGEIWFDKSNSERILLVKGNSGGRNIFVQTNEPKKGLENPQEGDIWFQTEPEIPIE
jgi:hypothetical protein